MVMGFLDCPGLDTSVLFRRVAGARGIDENAGICNAGLKMGAGTEKMGIGRQIAARKLG